MVVYELDAITVLTAQMATLTQQLENMKVNVAQPSLVSYEYGGDPYFMNDYSSPFEASFQSEQVNFIPHFDWHEHNPYSNTFNPG